MRIKVIVTQGIVEAETSFFLTSDKTPIEVIQIIKKTIDVD